MKDPSFGMLEMFDLDKIIIFSPTCHIDGGQIDTIEHLEKANKDTSKPMFKKEEQLVSDPNIII